MPTTAPSKMQGITFRSNIRLSRVIRFSFALKGTLNTLSTMKNQLLVPINRFFGSFMDNRYTAITGPAAFAIIVMTPAVRPITTAKPIPVGMRSSGITPRSRSMVTTINPKMIEPMKNVSCSLVTTRSRKKPPTTPVMAMGSMRTRIFQSACRW